MKYLNAREVIPEWLLMKLQEHIQGEVIYIPRKDSARAGWGAANGTREMYMERNMEIIKNYNNGMNIFELSEKYSLSEYSIRKIISSMKKTVSGCKVYGEVNR